MKTIKISRCSFIRSTTAAGVAVVGSPSLGSILWDTKLRVLSIGVIGTIGGADRRNVQGHPLAEIVGLCDVDSIALAKAAHDH